VLAETEEVALGTMKELDRNRGTIQSAISRVKDVDADMDASNSILKKMNKWWNKF
jgi:hypothetical protein